MRMYDIIAKKRDKKPLTNDEIRFFVNGYVKGEIPDYQVSALLMAIYLNGMTDDEILSLTTIMAHSGQQADLSKINGVTVDKHSTGGVGDKTTLIVVPIVAALGGKVAKMSGRGLGHTGGTIDKLESINGFRTELSPIEFAECVNTVGACIVGQSGNLAPADKKLYALRDVTATVSCIPLIASSIMSKKLASGSKCIVLDVKVGSGAFMKNSKNAEKLAQEMVNIGKNSGRKTAALITNMDIPLGNSIGNSLEVIESVNILKDNQHDNLCNLCIELAAAMISLTTGKDIDECRTLAKNAVSDGSAFRKFREMVSAQGGDVRLIDNTDLFKKAEYSYEIKSSENGFILQMNAEKIGKSSVILGAGRTKKDDIIDHSAGIILKKKTGDYVNSGDVIAVLYTNKEASIIEAAEMFLDAVSFSEHKPDNNPLIYKIIM